MRPIQTVKPGHEYFYLHGAVEPKTGQRFFTEHERLNSDCFQVFLGRFAEAFPRSHNVMILDNGQFHKAKKLSVPSNVEFGVSPALQTGAEPGGAALARRQRRWPDFYKCLSDLRKETRTVLI